MECKTNLNCNNIRTQNPKLRQLNLMKQKPGSGIFCTNWPGNGSGLFYRTWGPHGALPCKIEHEHIKYLAVVKHIANDTFVSEINY